MTARITIGSLIVLALFGVVAVLVVRVGVAAILHNATVTLLRNDAAPFFPPLQKEPIELDQPVEGQLLAVVDPAGIVLESTLPRGLNSKLTTLAKFEPEPRNVTIGQSSYLVLTQQVVGPSGTYTLITARSETAGNLILDRLTGGLVAGAIVLVASSGLASWLLARTTLRPVGRMRRRAQAIAEGPSTGLLPVGPARDELAALATTLNDLIGRLRASADREKQMVSDASHELRTPLAVLQGQLELAELDAGNADALLSDVRSSRATVLRLNQLATNLLELSRIEAAPGAGRSDWRALTTELTDAIDRARLLVDADAEAANSGANGGGPVDGFIDGLGFGPGLVDSDSDDAGDDDTATGLTSIDFDYASRRTGFIGVGHAALSPPEFARILDNLLSNAIGAVEPGGSVNAELIELDDRVRLTVTDSGPGMPEDFIPVALDRFTRADASRSAHSGGGLGLAIVSALVASAGGTIDLSNVPGGGLKVLIELPLA
ncbi:MAG: two-component system, OmpR family, sensor kinase [Microbacteriaceae bacterium]|jgi:two-component system OmpR family sensor kinase|nr:two-component system, OmpR family, sensor kinase [Microbacteriaceae bacterium]